MSISFESESIRNVTVGERHILCFPAMSLVNTNEFSPKEQPYIRELYERYPVSNYYNSSTRAKPGTIKSFVVEDGGIVNIFCRLYPHDTGAVLSDSHSTRIANFKKCLGELEGVRMTDILVEFPSLETADYVACIEDFMSTYKLVNGVALNITVHSFKPPCNEVYKLVVGAVKENILYEIDFARLGSGPETGTRGVIDAKNEATVEAAVGAVVGAVPEIGILSLFPDDNRWLRIKGDMHLQKLARDKRLVDLIGTGNYFPAREDIFNAFSYLKTDPKVVIIGQDPYHGPGQAHGLSFSVRRGIKAPPSLRNVFKAMENDKDLDPPFKAPVHGCLTAWAERGVILLNTSLTVEEGKAGSHIELWKSFTDRLIEVISTSHTGLVFMLWGKPAKEKRSLIKGQHLILEFCHPSPSVPGNTFPNECKHFSKCNAYLRSPVDWSLPS